MEKPSQPKQDVLATKLNQLIQENDIKMENISGVPVFTIETNQRGKVILKIAQSFSKNIVFRIINAQFVDDAIEFGTDKGRVDEYDFRRVANGVGYDVWRTEEQAIKQGLKKSDVFCGTPYYMFAEEVCKFSSSGLGIPDDRAAILIYDGAELQEMEGSEEISRISDSYKFKDTKNKKRALLGIIKFKESFIKFERKLNTLQSVDEKIALLEKKVFQNLNNKNDLKNAPYIALNIIAILRQESLKNTKNLSADSIKRIERLKILSNYLECEIKMIEFTYNMNTQVEMTYKAFLERDNRKMELMRSLPDTVINNIKDYLHNNKVNKKYEKILLKIINEAEECKQKFNL